MAIYIVEEHTFRLFLGSNNTRGIRIKLAAENEKKQKSIKKSINTHTHVFRKIEQIVCKYEQNGCKYEQKGCKSKP